MEGPRGVPKGGFTFSLQPRTFQNSTFGESSYTLTNWDRIPKFLNALCVFIQTFNHSICIFIDSSYKITVTGQPATTTEAVLITLVPAMENLPKS